MSSSVARLHGFSQRFYVPLFVSLLALYMVPDDIVLAWPFAARLVWTLIAVPLPIFFAGLIFSMTFRDAQDRRNLAGREPDRGHRWRVLRIHQHGQWNPRDAARHSGVRRQSSTPASALAAGTAPRGRSCQSGPADCATPRSATCRLPPSRRICGQGRGKVARHGFTADRSCVLARGRVARRKSRGEHCVG